MKKPVKAKQGKKKPEKFYKDVDFMGHSEARTIRILAEYLGPKKKLREQGVEDTIVFFGSARSMSLADAQKQVTPELRRLHSKKKLSKVDMMRIDQLEHKLKLAKYYDDAVELSERLTLWTKSLHQGKQKYYICSGGGPGMMEAANRGAYNAKGKSLGFNISLPKEPCNNPFISPNLNFEFHYFFTRKYWFAYLAKALVIFPGGFGTLDELAEIMTLVQTRKTTKSIPIVIYGSDYWKKVLNLYEMIKWGTISAVDLKLVHFSNDVDEAYAYLTKELTKRWGA